MINKKRLESEQAACVILGRVGVGGGIAVEVDVLKCCEFVLEVAGLWADTVDSWIASSGLDGFTPSEEHCMLL